MLEPGCDACFAQEALAKLGIAREMRRKDFERNGPIEALVSRAA